MSITREKLKELMEWENKTQKIVNDARGEYLRLGNEEKDKIHNNIISFLKKNKNRVFTLREIAAAIIKSDKENIEKKIVIFAVCINLNLNDQIELFSIFSKAKYYFGYKQNGG